MQLFKTSPRGRYTGLARVMVPLVAALALVAMAPGAQGCTIVNGGTSSCSIDAGGILNFDISQNVADNTVFTFTNSNGLSPGTDNNEAAIFISLSGNGGSSSGNGDGANGATITVNNYGTITLDSSSYDAGNFTTLYGMDLFAGGGDGVKPDSNGTDGGRGGDTGPVTVNNTAAISFLGDGNLGVPATVTVISIDNQAGAGGEMNGGAGDQKGGSAGDAKQITVNNSGSISVGSASDYFEGDTRGHLIAALGESNLGGTENGNGGSGSTIDITNSANLSLYYDEQGSGSGSVAGIQAQSLGGDGTKSSDDSDPGGKGESGRPITITNSGNITVFHAGTPMQVESAAIFALSRGGDGGESSDKNVGGNGGSGSVNTNGNADQLLVNADGGRIQTSGDGVRGIVARSEGGAGGNGNSDSRSTGGNGGGGGRIQVDFQNGSQIDTQGPEAYGILAQSVGGLGGDNAGTAGTGGDAGPVGVFAEAGTSITTQGDFSAGLTFHSVGGGGGTGADFTGVLAGAGGNGGNGGDAGAVTLTTASMITTSGDHAFGLLGQSIGGSGGTGGVGIGLVLALGGDGGGGGSGEVVELNNTGAVQTSGDYAVGILGQSISGGGGAGGAAGGTLSIGGTGGTGQNSALSYVTNSGNVSTVGNGAPGIVIQSIGGGGGTGGGATGIATIGGAGSTAGNGGNAQAFVVGGSVQTFGDHSYGIVTQSIGGGGGNGGDVVDLSVGVGLGIGGSGTGGGNGGVACVANVYDGCASAPGDPTTEAPQQASSSVSTSGDFSHGVVAQSIGGGGGNGGDFEGVAIASVVAIQVGGAAGTGGASAGATATFENLSLHTSGDNAKGLIAQSIAGGGGNGGNSTAVNVVTPVAIQVGGHGGNGGSSGVNRTDVEATVSLTDSAVMTLGSNSGAILAQSIGGGGGTGGSAYGFDVSAGFTFDSAIGGDGGLGGNGATVHVTLDGTDIQTGIDGNRNALYDEAASSHGLTAQSVGGGGGTGGTGVADALTVAAPTGEGESVAVTGTLAIGGKGGSGGASGDVQATLLDGASIMTGGDGSHGILAQSVGGGGGDGGAASSFSGSIGVPNTTSVDFSMTLGGKGGSGGSGDGVTVAIQDSATITTIGDNSNAIVAQSIGGGGGDGGVGNATNDKIGRGLNVSADIGLGGKGGSGGTGETVTVDLSDASSITTNGSGSRGVVAQSIGGGGGTGQGGSIGLKASGFTLLEALNIKKDAGAPPKNVFKVAGSGSVTLNIGANTGNGNTAGQVSVTTDGSITTYGGDADGVVAQSVGGGGGLGGTAGNDSANTSGPKLPRLEIVVDSTVDITASIGGSGGTGGNGGVVSLTHSGNVTTHGHFADAIVGQSIGGGGGVGGAATTGDGDQTVTIDFAVGGNGGAGGNGSNINMFFDDSGGGVGVSTAGYAAHGAVLQSIGGGGGQGGVGTATGGGHLSVGGGYGGNGGSAGAGGAITVDPSSYLTALTAGDDAYGLMAQSIGGGGGYGGAGGAEQGDDTLDLALQVTVGGIGGSSGAGGTVNISTGGNFQTTGDRSFGIVAQSIGGGGGIGGTADSDSLASVQLNSQDGSSGNGGATTVDFNDGLIRTGGDGAHAIIAQSIGGGGGIAGDLSGPALDTSNVIYGTTTAIGSGETVTVNVDADITTSGAAAHGIIAQSIGGGGGLHGIDGVLHAGGTGGTSGNGGNVNVTQAGTLQTAGQDSIGIFAQSVGIDNSLPVTVDVNGAVTGGSGNGIAVYIVEGETSVLNIAQGASVSAGGSTSAGDRGMAVVYTADYSSSFGADLTVNNSGTLTGNVAFTSSDSSSAGTVNNLNNGMWTPDASVGANVVNTGAIVVGGTPGMQPRSTGGPAALAAAPAARSVGPSPLDNVTRIAGNFSQGPTGRIVLSSDFENGITDRLAVAGDATLDGFVEIDALTLAPSTTLTVLTAGGSLTGGLTASDTPAVDFGTAIQGTAATIQVNTTRFGNAFAHLDGNQGEVGRYHDRLFTAGAPGYGAVFAGLSNLSAANDGGRAYARGLASMSPGSTQAVAAAQATLADSRLDGALNCDDRHGRAISDMGSTCVWAAVGGSGFEQDGVAGYNGTQWGAAGGALVELSPDWFAGFAMGAEFSRFEDANDLANASGTTGYASAALGREFGNLVVSGGLMASYGAFDVERAIVVPGVKATASAGTDVITLGARLRGAYTFSSEWGYLRPMLDLDVVHTRAAGYTEEGAGALNLEIEDQQDTIFIGTPAVELGSSVPVENGLLLGGFVNLGVSFSTADDWTTQARFENAPAGSQGFSSTVPIPDPLARIGVGVSLTGTTGVEARLEYQGAIGNDYQSHGALLRVSTLF